MQAFQVGETKPKDKITIVRSDYGDILRIEINGVKVNRATGIDIEVDPDHTGLDKVRIVMLAECVIVTEGAND